MKARLKNILWQAETIKRFAYLEDFGNEAKLQLCRLEALQTANDKYPWVGSWHKASLLELEVRQAATSCRAS